MLSKFLCLAALWNCAQIDIDYGSCVGPYLLLNQCDPGSMYGNWCSFHNQHYTQNRLIHGAIANITFHVRPKRDILPNNMNPLCRFDVVAYESVHEERSDQILV